MTPNNLREAILDLYSRLKKQGIYRGIGRPDKPETTAGKISGDEPDGAIYISTDGGGVKAYQWTKFNGSWQVTKGDTGWITFHSNGLLRGRIEIRRTEEGAFIRGIGGTYNSISIKATTSKRINLTGSVPVGFKSALGAYGILTNDYTKAIGSIMLSAKNDGNNSIQIRLDEIPSSNAFLRPQEIRYSPDDVWVESLDFK